MRYDFKYEILIPGASSYIDITCIVDSRQSSETIRLTSSTLTSMIDEFSFVIQPQKKLSTASFEVPYTMYISEEEEPVTFYDTEEDEYTFVRRDSNAVMAEIISAINNNQKIFVKITLDGTRRFTGYIRQSFSQDVSRFARQLNITVEDMSYLLDNKISESFQYPSTIGGTKYQIFNPLNTDESIVHQLLYMAGYTDSDISATASITNEILHASHDVNTDRTYRQYLDTLLYEYGYVQTFDREGRWSYVSVDLDSIEVDYTLTNQMLTDSFSHSGDDSSEDGIKLVWSDTEVLEGKRLYMENLPLSDGVFTGREIEAGAYFPDGGDVEEIWQSFNKDFLDIPYVKGDVLTKNEDLELIATDSITADAVYDVGISEVVSETEPKRARYLFQNVTGSTLKIYRFDIYGKALIRSNVKEYTVPEDAEFAGEYVSEFIFDEEDAERRATSLSRFSRYSKVGYSWDELDDIEVGSFIKVNPTIDIDAYALIMETSRNFYAGGKGRTSITANAITPYSTDTLKINIISPSSGSTEDDYNTGANDALANANIVTPGEKLNIKREWEQIQQEYTLLISVLDAFELDTTDLETAYNALDVALVTGIPSVLGVSDANLNTNTTLTDLTGVSEYQDFYDLFKDYRNESTSSRSAIEASNQARLDSPSRVAIKLNYSDYDTISSGSGYVHGLTSDMQEGDIDGVITQTISGVSSVLVVPKQTITGISSGGTDVVRSYLIVESGVITPALYDYGNNAYYSDYNKLSEVTSGIIIGWVTRADSDLLSGEIYSEAFDLTEGKETMLQNTMKYLAEATNGDEFKTRAEELGIDNAFVTLAAYQAFIDSLYVNNLIIGDIDEANEDGDGFVFRAINDATTGEKTIQAWSDGKLIFEIDPTTRNVIFGDYYNGNGIQWDDDSSELKIQGTGVFTGELLHDAIETQEEKTSDTTITPDTPTRYKTSDVYSGLSFVSESTWTPITGTLDGDTIENIRRCPSTTSTQEILYTTSKNLSSPISHRCKITFNVKSSWYLTDEVILYVNGVEIASVSSGLFEGDKTKSVFYTLSELDTIATTGATSSAYVKLETYGKGLVFDINDGTFVFLGYENFYSYLISLSTPSSFDSSSSTYTKYTSGQEMINDMSVVDTGKTYNTDTATSSLSINGGALKTVTAVTNYTNELRIYFNDSTQISISGNPSEGASAGWYNISGSFTLLGQVGAILTKNIFPKTSNAYDLGGVDFYYNKLFITTLVGMVAPFATTTVPSGWLECNGSDVSRITYNELFSSIGTTFGAGNGSTTFNLPDLRGEFIRGFDNSRNVDTGRVFGSFQSDEFKSHNHTYDRPTGTSVQSGIGGSSTQVLSGRSTGATGGSETRPRNIALKYCIKY